MEVPGAAKTMNGEQARFPCPCCGYLVFDEPPGSGDICGVCGWEDDVSQLRFPMTSGGANRPSLADAQRNFAAAGQSDPSRTASRRALGDETQDRGWRVIDLSLDDVEQPTPGVDYGGTYPQDCTQLYYWRHSGWRREP